MLYCFIPSQEIFFVSGDNIVRKTTDFANDPAGIQRKAVNMMKKSFTFINAIVILLMWTQLKSEDTALKNCGKSVSRNNNPS